MQERSKYRVPTLIPRMPTCLHYFGPELTRAFRSHRSGLLTSKRCCATDGGGFSPWLKNVYRAFRRLKILTLTKKLVLPGTPAMACFAHKQLQLTTGTKIELDGSSFGRKATCGNCSILHCKGAQSMSENRCTREALLLVASHCQCRPIDIGSWPTRLLRSQCRPRV